MAGRVEIGHGGERLPEGDAVPRAGSHLPPGLPAATWQGAAVLVLRPEPSPDGRPQAAGCLVLDPSTPVPTVLHWGADPGEVDDAVADLWSRPVATATPVPLTLVPVAADGPLGRPGLEAWPVDEPGRTAPGSVRFTEGRCDLDGATLTFEARSPAGLVLAGTVVAGATLQVSLRLRNESDRSWVLARLATTLPLPHDADELLRFDGRWCAEMTPARAGWAGGTQVVENRRGRTSHDHVPVAFVGHRGFGEHRGPVHGVHLAWSGNGEVRFEDLGDARRAVQVGEVLLPGEVVLAPGDVHESPVVHGVHGEGLTAASRGFHTVVRRSLATRDLPPRPVTCNTWEAVYFDHDGDRLRALADVAARVGVERFVLDDGWFGSRRDDSSGLGDWWVSPDAHPDGLGPLIDHVRGLGMAFGLWVEPEMANPDSDLLRAHPGWVLGDPGITIRNQVVLDLALDECREHLLAVLDGLLADHDISYLKWDHNRDLVGAGGRAQTLALHHLLDELRARHPGVEIESCASGGGRMDLSILERTERVWTSDCNDALERQTIQRGATHLLPPEVLGAHVGPPRAHTTGRTHRLHLRAATALFGHLGIEWDLLEASERHLEALTWWIEQHKARRPLLHGGDVVRLDPVGGGHAHGVVSPDRSHALWCWAQLTSTTDTAPPRLVPADLDPDRTYEVRWLEAPGEVLGLAFPPAWMEASRRGEPIRATGRTLGTVGLQLPVLHPESALLVELVGT